MNKLAICLANIVRDRVSNLAQAHSGGKLETRFIFHGPPLEIMEEVFKILSANGGIEVGIKDGGSKAKLPVLLLMPAGNLEGANPGIGYSGRCDDNHLLHVRNDPHAPSFVALLPPGQHSNRSVATTTEEFGLSSSSNTGHATFEEWWGDGFVQHLVRTALDEAGIGEDRQDEAISIVEAAAMAVDEVDDSEGARLSAWSLLSRLFSIPDHSLQPRSTTSLALACGMPPMQDGTLSSKVQRGVLSRISDVMAEGFKTAIDRLAGATQDEPTKLALHEFLAHVQRTCQVTTAFERATPAFYLPCGDLELHHPPAWWNTLTCERWSELLEDDSDGPDGELTIACTNALVPPSKGLPTIVSSEVVLSITDDASSAKAPVDVTLTGGGLGRTGAKLQVPGRISFTDVPPESGQRSPITYKVSSDGRKTASARVISLATWQPGILVTSRMATKLSPPKKPRRSGGHAEWETTLSLPGSGRFELLVLVAPGVVVEKAEEVPDDATELGGDVRHPLQVHPAKAGGYHVEIDADDGNYQLEVTFMRPGSARLEVCRVFVVCEEVREEGCKSEFERLIRLNRRHLEKFDAKSVVQLDRHARLASLQSWMLDEVAVSRSFIPLVLADDYGTRWAAPDWDGERGPILSQARFLQDPRPSSDQFHPPKGFVEARQEIARRIRATSDQAGLVESAPLGSWLARDEEFRQSVEAYLEAYSSWLAVDRDVACWVDAIAICQRESGGRTLARVPDAIVLSPLHPLRLAWHCLAQRVLLEEVEGSEARPCPAASIFDPDCIPDILEMRLQSPGGPAGLDTVTYLSVECNSDYWSVLWHGKRLDQIATKSRAAPFDEALGLVIGGVASGFSPAQVARALEDVSDLLPAKPVTSIVVSSGGGASDACNEGLATWCARRFGGDAGETRVGIGPRVLEIFDTRPVDTQPDQAMIANLSEDTGNHVRWYFRQPSDAMPDLGIIAQLDSAQPESTSVNMRSPIGTGGLVRHRVRRQLDGSFLSESRQSLSRRPSGDEFADKVAACINAIENGQDNAIGLQFSPNVHAVVDMLKDRRASYVAVSSSAIDPACFLGGWIEGTYLWDYDLPSYSHRAGDTSGYYLLSQVRGADRDALGRILRALPSCSQLDDAQVEEILLEVARRGIPTVRGLSGDDTGATGDLGLFLAVRLLQDQFRTTANHDSLLPVLAGSPENATISIVVPVDPFLGYLADMARSVGRDRKDASLSRPDLLVVGIQVVGESISLHLTPIEVKCRHKESTLGASEARDALGQARALASLLQSMQERAASSIVWRLAYQHLLMSMIGFGLRVYSQHEDVCGDPARWAAYHERIADAVFRPKPLVSIDCVGRLIVIDGSPDSGPRDLDGDGFAETIVISPGDAGKIVGNAPNGFYEAVRSKVGTWRLLPEEQVSGQQNEKAGEGEPHATQQSSPVGEGQLRDGEVGLAGEPEAEERDVPPVEQPAPTGGRGILLSLGATVDGFTPRQLSLNISDTRLNQLNMGVVGDLGTGKTQLLKSLIAQICRSAEDNRGIKPRFLIFDYKRDYSHPEFVAATGARVVKPKHLPINLFDTSAISESTTPWLDRFRFFADVLDKVYSGIGPVQRDKLKSAVRNAYEACSVLGRPPTLYDIHAEYREILGGKSDSPMAIIDDLVDMEIFEKDPAKSKPFGEFLDGVVVISLDAMGQDDRGKNMLVATMLNMFYEYMLRTPKRPFEGTEPQLRAIDSYLLVDEADNIMRYEFDVLRKLLLEGREFGVGVILASQFLRHFKTSGTDYKEPLLTWFIHKVPNVTPAELGALGLTGHLGDLSGRVKTLAKHCCLYKSFDSSGEVIQGLPFYELVKLEQAEPR